MKPIGIKPFNRKDYNKFRVYEDLLMEHIKIPKHELLNNPDVHGIDILVINEEGERVGALEAESHGKYWINKKFPFKTCHFLYRKKKYIEPHHFYIMMNRRAVNALMVPFTELPRHRLKIMNNAKVNKEKFYDVPIKECVVGWKDINKYLNLYFNHRRY